MVTVTVLSCLYGTDYDEFESGWREAVSRLERPADDVIVVAPKELSWRHPQAECYDLGLRLATTDWIWLVDMDDLALPSGLNGIDDVEADVWLAGYERDGFSYIPRALTNDAYLASGRNSYPAGSMIRRTAALSVGGFRDVAFQDWDLWLRLARCGWRFESTGRVNYVYRQHSASRTARELTPDTRQRHLLEMEDAS